MYSSTVLCYRTRPPLSLSFNDRYCRRSSSFSSSSPSDWCSCSCHCHCHCHCNCCEYEYVSTCCGGQHSTSTCATLRFPINPTLLYNRQSSLLQLSGSRRLILDSAAGESYYCRFPVSGSFVDRDVCDYEIKGRGNNRRSVGRRGRKLRCLVSEETNEIRRLSRSEDADTVINLLSNELSDDDKEGSGFGVKKEGVAKRLEVETTRVSGGGKKNVGLASAESNLERRVQSRKCEVKHEACGQEEESEGLSRQRNRKTGKVVKDRVHRREENEFWSRQNNHKTGKVVEDQVCRREENEILPKQQSHKIGEVMKDGVSKQEESEVLSRQMNRKMRKEGSSCSSYYSVSSSGDFESDIEEIKDNMISEEMRNRYDVGLKRMEDSEVNRKAMDVHKGHRDHREEKVSLEQNVSRACGDAEWDWRKKSEKKLTDVSTELMKSKKESLQELSKFSRTHELNAERASNLYSQTTDKKEESSMALNVDAKASIDYSNEQDVLESHTGLQRKSRRSTEVCRTCGSEVKKSSKSSVQLIGREENLLAMGESVHMSRVEHKKEGCLLAATAADGNRQETFKAPKIQVLDPEMSSKLNGKLKARVDNWQESMHTGSTSINARKGEHQHVEDHIIKQSHLKKSRQISEFAENRHNTEMSGFLSDSKISGESLNSTTTSYTTPNNQHSRPVLGDFHTKHIREGSKEVIHASNNRKVASSQLPVQLNIENQVRNVTSVMQLGVDARLTNVTSDKMAIPTETMERPSSSQALDVKYQEKLPQLSREYDKISSESIVVPPPSQLVDRGSSNLERTSEIHIQEIQLERDSIALSGSSEFDSLDKKCEMYRDPLHSKKDEDALASALLLEESSRQFVGEFMKTAQHELLTSKMQMSQSDPKLVYRSDERSQGSSAQLGYEVTQSKNHDSSSQHGSPATKGPSDEVWHVTNPEKESTESHVLEESKSSQAIVRRTGRSLWSILADIVRLRWGSRSETLGSAPTLAGKSSSHESVSSEAWFSGHERDDSIDENMKRERTKTPQKATGSGTIQPELIDTQGQVESPPDVKKGHFQEKISSPSVSESSIALNVISSALDSTIVPFTAEIVSSSISHPLSGTVSAVENSSPGIVKVSLSGSGSIKGNVQSGEKLTDAGGMEENHGGSKLKRLQRNMQVPRDRFDEWEEAYRLESQQRKIDEIFMREALVEAKKAADNWEVPVGAVLVQHGKIIARGYNLVEELRDSTAHAEMICIREASNVLRSWRISDATLYVTLEPCPMCAGAILQARIDTLVWGAPNKLLGADGSWVRLFPAAEGGNNSEMSDKPAAPVHPFHPKMTIRRGVLGPECADIMQQFFQLRRRNKEKKSEPPTPPSCLPISHQSKLLNKMHDVFHFPFCL